MCLNVLHGIMPGAAAGLHAICNNKLTFRADTT